MPPAAEYFIGTVNGELACHIAVAPMFQAKAYRATRLVTMPEWQGAGVGFKFLNYITQYHLDGKGRRNKKFATFFHTSHPQLCMALRKIKCGCSQVADCMAIIKQEVCNLLQSQQRIKVKL